MSAAEASGRRRRAPSHRSRLLASRLRISRPHMLVAVAAVALTLGAACTSASGAPFWRLSSRAAPSNLAPDTTGLLAVVAEDLGDAGVKGDSSHVKISDSLPAGLALSGGAAAVRARRSYPISGEAEEAAFWSCQSQDEQQVSCESSLDIPPYEALELLIPVTVSEPAGTVTTLQNTVNVQGGLAEEAGEPPVLGATLARAVKIDAAQLPFGIEAGGYTLTPENEAGEPERQAGSHPFQLTANVNFNQTLETLPVQQGAPPQKGLQPASPGLAKDLSFGLPPGLLGNVTAAEQCPEFDFSAIGPENVNFCPAGAAIGVATVFINIPKPYGYAHFAVPLFNLVPAPGEPARFGFEIDKVAVVLDTKLRSSGDYGVTASVSNASEVGQLLGSRVTFWGVPGDPRHDASRGWKCLLGGLYVHSRQACEAPSPRSLTPFLTMPTTCSGDLLSSTTGDSWAGEPLEEADIALADGEGNALAGFSGCGRLPFAPQLDVRPLPPSASEQRGEEPPSSVSAATPVGLQVAVKNSQEGTLSAQALGDADVRSTSVTLPAGVTLNASAANGLQACSEAQVGYQGQPAEPDPLAPGASQPLTFSEAPAGCPEAAKVGLVNIRTPLLAQELSGSVYLAEPAPQGEPGKNPFNSLIALYIVAEDEALGLRVKLAGEGSLDPTDGQLTTTFQDTPQVPFSELELRLFPGPRASLASPALCGTYPTSASFTPWSYPFQAPLSLESSAGEFTVGSGPGGTPCPRGEPFAPALSAGSEDRQAGAFSEFTLGLERPDGNQPLSAISLKLPAGAAAMLSHVTPCPEPQASLGSCGPESQIGQASASAGVGPDPYTEQGAVFITGPYQGAPFGLSIVTPAVAGPFDLGDVVVRSKIEVDPHTAQVTISSPVPTFIQGVGRSSTGIPLQLQRLQVDVDRPDFEYNPTSCEPKHVEATLDGAGNGVEQVSIPFQVAGCQGLPFKPGVSAVTRGKTSKADGASLGLTFKSRVGEAHVARTVLTIPSTLPARLTTIQKACVAATFEANPAACGEGSDIGTAVVHTPVLKNPLSGPIYLVSHGNAAWPDAELVLQGEGVTVILDGQTAIKKGVTTSSFLSVPDAPFESVEATLPEGPHSALTTNLPLKDHYSLCGQHLAIPTALTGQNGTAITASVKVSVQGCAAVRGMKARRLTRRQKLARALKACRKPRRRSPARRAACERGARRQSRAR